MTLPDRLLDLHVWRVGRGKYARILSLQADQPIEPDEVRRELGIHEEFVHVTVEFNRELGAAV